MKGSPPPIISAGELRTLGVFLYGPRWQTALAGDLKVNIRTVQRWAAGDWPVSPRCAALIVARVRARHASRTAALQRSYIGMAEAMSAQLQAALL